MSDIDDLSVVDGAYVPIDAATARKARLAVASRVRDPDAVREVLDALGLLGEVPP
jgi:hypothetical protein